MKSLLVLLPALLAIGPALAEDPAPAAPREKVSTVIVYGDDPCPRSSDDEIVVCAREPESARYRIPEKLRKHKARPADSSWAERVQLLETVSKAGLPNSCSPIGSNGQTGCMAQLLRQARDERAAQARNGVE